MEYITEAIIEQKNFVVIFTIIGILFLVAMYTYIRVAKNPLEDRRVAHPYIIMGCMAAAALIVRLVIAYETPGFETDINCYKAWSHDAFNGGMAGFYARQDLAAYPPLYMYVLYMIGGIREFFAIDIWSATDTLLVKLPSIIADVGLAFLLFGIARGRVGDKAALMIGVLILFSPAIMMNSTVWGQVDVFLALMLILVLWLMMKDKLLLAGAAFGLMVLLKPQAVMIGPLILFYVIFAIVKSKHRWKKAGQVLIAIALAAGVFFICALPFKGQETGLLWLVDEYTGMVDLFPQATLNAMNLFALMGYNFINAEETLLLGLPIATWGIIFIVCVCAYTLFLYIKRPQNNFLFALCAFLLGGIFMFAHGMHERYIYPVPVLLLVAYALERDRRLLYCAIMNFGVLLLAQSLPLYYYLIWIPQPIATIVSAAGLAVFAYTGYVITKLALQGGPEHPVENKTRHATRRENA